MTPEEAKTKWCPMVRDIGNGAPGANTAMDVRNPEYARCIGPECAMWLQRTTEQGHCGLKNFAWIDDPEEFERSLK